MNIGGQNVVKLAIGACQKVKSTLTFFTFHIFHLVLKKVKQCSCCHAKEELSVT